MVSLSPIANEACSGGSVTPLEEFERLVESIEVADQTPVDVGYMHRSLEHVCVRF